MHSLTLVSSGQFSFCLYRGPHKHLASFVAEPQSVVAPLCVRVHYAVNIQLYSIIESRYRSAIAVAAGSGEERRPVFMYDIISHVPCQTRFCGFVHPHNAGLPPPVAAYIKAGAVCYCWHPHSSTCGAVLQGMDGRERGSDAG